MTQDKIIFLIHPQTHIRSTQGDTFLFRIPMECKRLKGEKPCAAFRKTGHCDHVLSLEGRQRKAKLDRYNKYKDDLKTLAYHHRFTLPVCGLGLYFFVPMPPSWSAKKKAAMHGQMKLSKPDIDNYEKAFYDAMSIRDEAVGQLSGHGKFWFDPEKVDPTLRGGYIEVLTNLPLYNPFDVVFVDQSEIIKKVKRRLAKNTVIAKRIRKPKPLKLKKHWFEKEDKIK